ncbi:probable cyclin-dependent serine/threonine-protein kinase DDB_G0292550 [Metopolophium dirhodum]|uniref:probable cyclin-dependent serine/threonine-protein kinase DDB_G0292550 n=1 Tax=Metopolophium dirhodum TaxID=44670 RepID=UPI00298F88D4|nr:probable cyclin-dependent serine/threonine-protein kinase DDB_G0292550 [Metopolophium dirhodum]
MSQVKEISDLTDSDEGKQIIRSLNRLNYKQGSSGIGETDNILRIPNPAKRRPIGYDEYPNFERQYIQNINIPTAAKTEGDNDQSLNQDDNYHFLMSLLPYLREVPKNRKMAIRHKLQRVFIDEQERKISGRNINVNHPNLNNFHTPFANMFMTDPMNQPQQTPRLPPPPYPYKQDVFYNYVPSAARPSASVPMPKAIPSTSTLHGNLIVQQQPIFSGYPVSVGLPSGHQQYYNAKANNNANNNNSSFSYNATTVDKNNANKNNINRSFGYNATAVDNNNANNNNSSFSYNATAVDNNNANNHNNNSSFGYNATATESKNANNDNSSFSYNATTVDKNNANKNNNNSSFGYNATAVDNNNANNNNSSFSSNATTVDNNNSSFIYNATAVDNDNATFTNQSGVTGEPQTLTYLQ